MPQLKAPSNVSNNVVLTDPPKAVVTAWPAAMLASRNPNADEVVAIFALFWNSL